jgi:hypothetical protein
MVVLMTHAELKSKVERLHALLTNNDSGTGYQIAIDTLVKEICDGWGRPAAIKVICATLEHAAERAEVVSGMRHVKIAVLSDLYNKPVVDRIIRAAEEMP